MNVERLILKSAAMVCAETTGRLFAPAAVSARHVHLSAEHIEALFGRGATLTVLRALSQPGQFAANQRVELRGPKGTLSGVRVLGPARRETQVELSVTDAVKIGIRPVVRMSGDLADTPGATLVGPAGSVALAGGVIVAARHLHISPEQAALFGLRDGDAVTMRLGGARTGTLGGIVVRCGAGHDLELHLDTDEANALLLQASQLFEIDKESTAPRKAAAHGEPPPTAPLAFIGEWEVKQAAKAGHTRLTLAPGGIITPLARDTAKELRIEVQR